MPKKPASNLELNAFLHDPKEKPVYVLPSGIPVDVNRQVNGNNSVSANGTSSKTSSKKPKPKAMDPPSKQRFTADKSFDPDVRSVRLADLLKVYSESQVHFADAQSIRQKDMAAYLYHLLPYQLSEPAFRSRPDPGYSSSLLKSDVRSFVREILESCANWTLQLFQPYCIDTVIRTIGLQLPTAGYLIILQVLGQKLPDVTRDNMQRFIDARVVNKPRHESMSQQLYKLEDVMLISHDCESTDASVTASSIRPSIDYYQFSAEQMALIVRLETFGPTDYQMPIYFGGGPQDEEQNFDQELELFERQRKIKRKKLTSTICNKPVSLFKLYKLVKNRDGFESVSNEKKWTEVASECCSLTDHSGDLGRRCREVYEKRLLEFDKFMSAREHEMKESVELAARFKDLSLPAASASTPTSSAHEDDEPAAIVGVAHQLNAEAIDTLAPGQELEGSAIIAYLNFQKTTVWKKVYVFDPFFFDFLAKEGICDKARSFIQDLNIFDFELLLFVIHISANKEKKGGHWVLAAADSRNHSLSYFDSMAGGLVNDGDYPDVEEETRMEKILQFLNEEHARLQTPGLPADWRIRPVGDMSNCYAVDGKIPQQNNSWDCGVFVCEFGKCLIRDEKFNFEQSDILLREQIKAVLQSLVNETAPRKPEMEPERTEGMEGGPKEQLNAAQSEDQETRLNERLKKFVRCFVEKFEKKIKQYSDELELEEKTKKAGKIADTLAGGAIGMAAVVPGPIKSATQWLCTKGPISLGSYDHREKAKRCIAAITSRHMNEATLRRIIAGAGFDIFLSFEKQFSEITDTHGIWGREIEKLAQDAVDRIMNYVYKNAVQCLDTSALVSEAVIMGESKKGMTAMIFLSKPGRTVKSKHGKTVKSSEIYSKTGLVMIKDYVRVHYSKEDDDIGKFGFRLALEWESEKRDEEFLKKYQICERPSGDVYKYLINAEDREQIVSDILKEIDDEDPSKRLKRIDEGVATLIQSFGGWKEPKKNKDEGSFFFNVTDPVESFTGRRVELKKLHDLMQESSKNATVTSRIVSISGLGGVGKTQLVRRYIHEHCQDYDNNILWMDAENYKTLNDSFIKLAEDARVRISTKDESGIRKDVRTVVNEVYRHFANRKSLFVFDNAEKYSIKQDDDPSKDRGIVTFLPTSLKGYAHKPHFIITSRNQTWPGKVEILLLHEFSVEDARDFIRNALKRDESNREMDELAETLQYLPLALQQAVAYIRITNDKMKMMGGAFDINDYLTRYEKKTKELLDFKFPEDSDENYLQTTLTTWNITTDKMRDDSEHSLALNILDIIAYIAPDNIPAEMFFGLDYINNDKEKFGDAVLQLVRYSMVHWRGEQSTLNVHRLVQQVTRLKLSEEMRNEEIIVTTFQLLQKCYPSNGDTVENITIMRKLLPHIEVILTYMDDWSAKKPKNKMMIEKNFITEILELLSNGYRIMSNPSRGKHVLLRQLAIEQKYLGPDHCKVAETLVNLGRAYHSLGDHEKERELNERALPIWESHYGSKHYKVAQIMGNLGNAHGSLGDYEKEEDMMERALPILESCYDSEHYGVVRIMQNLGITYGLLGDHETKKELMESVLPIQERHFGLDHFEVARTLTNLGDAHGSLGNAERAKELMERALPILVGHYGPDHFEVGWTMFKLGNAYCTLGDHEKEKELVEHAIPILESHYSPDHFQVAQILENLGTVYGSLGNHEKEKELIERALPNLESHYGSEHIEVVWTMVKLGYTYVLLGEAEKAKELMERALPILERYFGPDHFEVAQMLADLGVAYILLGEAEKAKELMEHSLPILESHYGSEYYKVARIIQNLGTAYRSLGDNKKEKELLERALPILERHFGPEHHEVVQLTGKLGIAYRSLGDAVKAEEFMERALPILERNVGPKHFQPIVTLRNFEIAYGLLEDPGRKKELIERFLPILESHYGREHIQVARILEKFGNAYRSLGDHEKEKEMIKRALPILESHYGQEHIQVARILEKFGNAYRSLGDHEKEKEMIKRALPILESHYGSEHYEVALSRGNLGIANASLGDAEKAKELMERTLPILESHFGPDHFEVARTLTNLGVIHGLLGDAEKVKVLIERALPTLEEHFGPKHIQVAQALKDLGIAYGLLGDLERKKELLERALPILESHLGPDHLEVARTMVKLGNAYGSLEDAEKAKELMERALPILERHLGPDHLEVAQTLTNLGLAHCSLGDAEKVKVLMERALPILESHYGLDHIQVAGILENLGIAHGLLGDPGRKKELIERALPILESHYGPDHIQVAEILKDLGNTYGSLGDHEKRRELMERALLIEERHYGSGHFEIARTLAILGSACRSSGDLERQKECFERSLAIQEGHSEFEDRELLPVTLMNLGFVLGELGYYHEAYEMYERLSKLTHKQTSLHLAARYSNFETVGYILERGADILARYVHYSVLHCAVKNSHTDVIRLILDKILKKDPHNISQHVNAKDADGDTPLMWAAETGEVEAAKILLEYGADLNIQNNDNMTALNWAEKKDHREIVQLLLNHNADHNIGDEDERILSAAGKGTLFFLFLIFTVLISYIVHVYLHYP